MNRIRILLADDHEEFLASVRGMLSEQYDIVGSARDGGALVIAAREAMPDLIVSDLNMPVMNGFQAATALLQDDHPIPVIFLTIESSPSYARKAMSIGARGYVLKTYAYEQLPKAIVEVLAGRQFVSPQVLFNPAS